MSPYTGHKSGATVSVTAASKLCLGCHDGVTAMDAFGGSAGDATNNKMTNAPGVVGTDLTNDHPIGVVYNTVQTDTDVTGEYVAVATVDSALGTSLSTTGSVSCQTCHDVHEYDSANQPLLRTARADLCTTCHIK